MKTPLGFLVFCLASSLHAAAPDSVSDFQAFVGERQIELHGFAQGAFGLFEMTKPVDVDLRLGFDVRWVNVRPLSAKVVATIARDHRSVHFRMNGLVPLTVEFNEDISKVVHLFGYAPEKDAPSPETPNVRFFGPGTHDAGLIDLKDNETLYLAPGAWVRGNVRSVGTRGVIIRGRGVLDGSDIGKRPASGGAMTGEVGTRNMIYLGKTVGAKIEGITIFNSESEWTVYMSGTTGTRVDGVKILNPSVHYGNDGFDISSSSNVLIENIFVRTNDDCVVVKNMGDVDMRDITVRHAVLWNMPTGGNGIEIGFEMRNKPARDIRFEDIDIIHVERGAAISIHNGDAAEVENVAYDDIRVEDARRKLFDFAVIYTQYGADKPASNAENSRRLDRGGTWDGLLSYPPGERQDRAKFRGHIRNVRVTNLRVVDGALPYSVIAGFDAEHRVENVSIEGLQYLGRPILSAAEAKCVIEYASGVEFK